MERSTSAWRPLISLRRPTTVAFLLGVIGLAALSLVVIRLGLTNDEPPSPWARLDTADVHALAFAPNDAQRLYFGHHDGLLESSDGGRSWEPATLLGADAMNVRPAGDQRIQIVGHEVYLESTDGGVTWASVPNDLPGRDLHAFAVDPADSDHAWTFVVGFGLFETTDAGRRWELREPGNWGYLTAFRHGSEAGLIALGPQSMVRSLDAGASWEALPYLGAPLAGGFAASGDGSVLYAGTATGLVRSTDQGQTWSETGFGGLPLALAVAPDDPMDVALVDDATHFYRSPDGGRSWPRP